MLDFAPEWTDEEIDDMATDIAELLAAEYPELFKLRNSTEQE